MATYYPRSSAQLDVLSTSYDRESPLLPGNNMIIYSEISSGIDIPLSDSRNHEMNIIDGEQKLQGLSLSLSTQMSNVVSTTPFQFQYSNPIDEASPSKDMRNNADYFSYDMQGNGNNPQYSMNPKRLGFNSYHYEQASTMLKSRYLNVAQQLLDEVVNFHDAMKKHEYGIEKNSNKVDEEECKGASVANELSPTETQDLQNKLDKLHSLLDEVDKTYKQYCHQMQILISSFDIVAGGESAKPYTALALKTISRHFRCLRDAVTSQIQATRKILGEKDNNGLGAIPRLRYVDQQLKQQRALQQFGMMRHAWRPQRGLPESAVTILRAWLFEHFLHPYPKDSEKVMLARQTGLTRSQVANWFINAHVRLWKPMVEEIHKEEFGDVEINPRSSPEHTPTTAQEKSWVSEDSRHQESRPSMAHESHDSKTNNSDHLKDPTTSGFNIENHGFYTHNGTIPSVQNANGHQFITSAYQMSELGDFSVDNNTQQVSLALGLRGNGGAETSMEVSTSEYPYLEQVNQQHRFGNSHILNDFVA